MESISVVIITLNEAENIGHCIDSVAQIAEEIVVLDSFSTDATAAIAKQKGAKFFQQKFEGYIEQKNKALTLAKNEWVLSLDADELLSEEALQQIQQIKDWGAQKAFAFNRLNNYCGQWIRHGGWYPDRKTRLFKKTEGRWGGTNPHDKFELYDASTIAHIPGNILHYSFRNRAQHIAQAKNFSAIAANALFARGKKKVLTKLLFSPIAKFLRDYIFRLGFLDGQHGLYIAYISAKAVYWKYSMLQQLNQNKKKQ